MKYKKYFFMLATIIFSVSSVASTNLFQVTNIPGNENTKANMTALNNTELVNVTMDIGFWGISGSYEIITNNSLDSDSTTKLNRSDFIKAQSFEITESDTENGLKDIFLEQISLFLWSDESTNKKLRIFLTKDNGSNTPPMKYSSNMEEVLFSTDLTGDFQTQKWYNFKNYYEGTPPTVLDEGRYWITLLNEEGGNIYWNNSSDNVAGWGVTPTIDPIASTNETLVIDEWNNISAADGDFLFKVNITKASKANNLSIDIGDDGSDEIKITGNKSGFFTNLAGDQGNITALNDTFYATDNEKYKQIDISVNATNYFWGFLVIDITTKIPEGKEITLSENVSSKYPSWDTRLIVEGKLTLKDNKFVKPSNYKLKMIENTKRPKEPEPIPMIILSKEGKLDIVNVEMLQSESMMGPEEIPAPIITTKNTTNSQIYIDNFKFKEQRTTLISVNKNSTTNITLKKLGIAMAVLIKADGDSKLHGYISDSNITTYTAFDIGCVFEGIISPAEAKIHSDNTIWNITNNTYYVGILAKVDINSKFDLVTKDDTLYLTDYGFSVANNSKFKLEVYGTEPSDPIPEKIIKVESDQSKRAEITLINVEFSSDVIELASSNSDAMIKVKWVLDVLVVDNASNPINGANVDIEDINGILKYSGLTTDATGIVKHLELAEYIANVSDMTNKVKFTPHKFNVTKGTKVNVTTIEIEEDYLWDNNFTVKIYLRAIPINDTNLKISNFTLSATLFKDGISITFESIVKNEGSNNLTGISFGYYIEDGATKLLIYSTTVDLYSGEQKTISWTLNLDKDKILNWTDHGISEGTVTISAMVDNKESISEIDEDDNKIGLSAEIELPDEDDDGGFLGICGPTVLLGLILGPVGLIARKLKK